MDALDIRLLDDTIESLTVRLNEDFALNNCCKSALDSLFLFETITGDSLMDIEILTRQILALPSETRAALAEKIIASLSDGDLSEIDEAWIREAERRCEELRSGKVEGIAASDVFAQIRGDLRCRQ